MCRPAAVLLGGLIALTHSARSFARALVASQIQPVLLLPCPKNKFILAACGTDLKNIFSRSGRVQCAFSPPVDAQSPSSSVAGSSLLTPQFPLCIQVPRLCRSLARGSAYLHAPVSRLCVAARQLLPEEYARIVGVHT